MEEASTVSFRALRGIVVVEPEDGCAKFLFAREISCDFVVYRGKLQLYYRHVFPVVFCFCE